MSDENLAKTRLDEALRNGMVTTEVLIKKLEKDVPSDFVVRDSAVKFQAMVDRVYMLKPTGPTGSRQLALADRNLGIHRHAMQQVASSAGVPMNYLDTLIAPPEKHQQPMDIEWRLALAERNLNEHFLHSTSRHLVRHVNGEVRGFLSDKFRRLDSRPLLDAFIGEAIQHGARPYMGRHLDVKTELQVVVPEIIEVVPGEFIALGASFGNSDFGAASLSIKVFFVRLWCLNGATAHDVMRTVHLGKRLDETVEFSQQTYELDTRTMVSALKDVLRTVFAPNTREETVKRIKATAEELVDWKTIQAKLSKNLTKDELEKAKQAFEGPDVLNLPPGNTTWRASNALSWLAKSSEVTDDRKMHLEKLAGEMVFKAA